MSEDKVAKVFVDASMNRMFNPYHFVNLVKQSGTIAAAAMNRTAVGWFMLNEIDHRYGLGDPVVGDMSARIVHEILNDYEELPDYDPGRGFANPSASARGTWEGYKPSHNPTFVRRGLDL